MFSFTQKLRDRFVANFYPRVSSNSCRRHTDLFNSTGNNCSFTFEDFGSLQKSRLLMTKLNSKTGIKGILVLSLNRRTDIARSESGSRGI